MSRTYVTEFEIEAEDNEDAKAKFKELGDSIYRKEMEQCNVVGETIIVEAEYDSKRICSVTGEEMIEGWVVNDGELYFKYEKDAVAWCISNGYKDLQEGFDSDVIYWTEWDTNNLINNL